MPKHFELGMVQNAFIHELTDIKQAFFSKTFPNIRRPDVTMLGPKNTTIQCISWTLGFEDRRADVGDIKTSLATLCKLYIGHMS
jgi:hypothetical protein